jgi:hypothetical protein
MNLLYQWTALPHDISELPPAMGISHSLNNALAAAGQVAARDDVLCAMIVLVAPALSEDLDTHYVPCGPCWMGWRDSAGVVHWRMRSMLALHRPDPALVVFGDS